MPKGYPKNPRPQNFCYKSLISVNECALPEIRQVPSVPIFWAGSDGHIYLQWHARWWQKKENVKRNKGNYSAVSGPRRFGRENPVHVLICEAFHGPKPSAKHQVSHEDGCVSNNKPENLKWRTCQENIALKSVHGTQVSGVKHPRAIFTAEQVSYIREQFRKAHKTIKDISAELNADIQAVRRCANFKTYPERKRCA